MLCASHTSRLLHVHDMYLYSYADRMVQVGIKELLVQVLVQHVRAVLVLLLATCSRGSRHVPHIFVDGRMVIDMVR